MLAGKQGFGIQNASAEYLAGEVKSIYDAGVRIGIIIGAGNIFRGMQVADKGLDRVTGDYLGMLGTIINAVAFSKILENLGCRTRAVSALPVGNIVGQYVRKQALDWLNQGEVVIVAGGTGNPYFTTDSSAALRAAEINADVVLKGTKVDGVFDRDPAKFPDAVKFDEISFSEVIQRNLRVMDLTAMTMCKENSIPIIVFDISQPGQLRKTVLGEKIGTIVRE